MARYVREVMTKNLVVSDPDDTIASAQKLMKARNIHSVLIPPPRGGRMWRILTTTDLLMAINSGSDLNDIPIAEYASPVSVIARPEWVIERALEEMINRGVKHLPVMDGNGNIVGMVSSTDIMNQY